MSSFCNCFGMSVLFFFIESHIYFRKLSPTTRVVNLQDHRPPPKIYSVVIITQNIVRPLTFGPEMINCGFIAKWKRMDEFELLTENSIP